MKIYQYVLATLFLAIFNRNVFFVNCLNSYIYLNEKVINEEQEIGTLVVDLQKELEKSKKFKNAHQTELDTEQQFTILDDTKLFNPNSYFNLDQSTGVLSIKSKIDREFMCLNRLCADPCELGALNNFNNFNSNNKNDAKIKNNHHHHNQYLSANNLLNQFSCRVNLKVLLMPSYNILNLNVFIKDINDNKPIFKTPNQTQFINENVPIGYKIPIDLAYDPDVGSNTIQSYEIVPVEDDLFKSMFKLEQNLNESQLYLVVGSNLDREKKSSYNLKIRAIDQIRLEESNKDNFPESTLNLNIEIIDINDNNPIFESNNYKFRISEDAKIDTLIGSVKAFDLDAGLNGLLKYRFVETNVNSNNQNDNIYEHHANLGQLALKTNQKQNFLRYFDLNELNGEIRLKNSVDYEQENVFNLVIEASDSGVGSLPSYANIEIQIIDINDNKPEVTVSFLSSLFKNESSIVDQEFKYDVYLFENTKANKFIAHVNIIDKDSNENGKFDWKVLINENLVASSAQKQKQVENEQILKAIKLNENSFTLNVASSQYLDAELNDHFNVTIIAWDHGSPKLNQSVYKFRIKLLDLNDNPPIFDQDSYDISIYENNIPDEVIFKLSAHDADLDYKNSDISYSIKQSLINNYLTIDKNGNIRSKIRYDRESVEKYIFEVIATDNGQPPLSSSVLINLNVLDMNDNKPFITFNTSFRHFFMYENQNEILVLKLNRYLESNSNSTIIDFGAIDKDVNENSQVEFFIYDSLAILSSPVSRFVNESSASDSDMFKLTKNGRLYLKNNLFNNSNQLKFDLNIVCKDMGVRPMSLNSSLKLRIELIEQNEYCIKTLALDNSVNNKNNDVFDVDKMAETSKSSIFINRDEINLSKEKDLGIFFGVEKDTSLESMGNDNRIHIELMTHKNLFNVTLTPISNFLNGNKVNLFKLKINFNLNDSTLNQLILGKYTIKLKLFDELNPTCTKFETFHLLIGNNLIDEKQLTSLLKSIKMKYKISRNNQNDKPDSEFVKRIFLSNSPINKQNSKLFDDEIEHDNEIDEAILKELSQSSKNLRVSGDQILYLSGQTKSAPSHFYIEQIKQGDFILLSILVLTIVLTSLFLAYISIICVYSKYKKKIKLKSKEYKPSLAKNKNKSSIQKNYSSNYEVNKNQDLSQLDSEYDENECNKKNYLTVNSFNNKSLIYSSSSSIRQKKKLLQNTNEVNSSCSYSTNNTSWNAEGGSNSIEDYNYHQNEDEFENSILPQYNQKFNTTKFKIINPENSFTNEEEKTRVIITSNSQINEPLVTKKTTSKPFNFNRNHNQSLYLTSFNNVSNNKKCSP